MAKMWAGRFSKETDPGVNDFNSSIAFDARMYRVDIQGSMAHAAMLGKTGIISKADAEAIIEGLKGILADLDSGALAFDPNAEDIHMFIEAELTARIGDPGKRLHTARSRNDQVAVDLRLYLREEIEGIIGLLKTLGRTVVSAAKEHTSAVMPGYTHLQRAQPVTFAHHLAAYGWMFARDIGRLEDVKKRMNECPLGCGALAGTTYPIDRQMTAEALGFDGPTENSLDGVSDRDYCIELCSALSILMMHLSRLSEEVVLWCSWEFKFIELDDAFATGSSIMPQKKNPDVAELVRGKTGRVYGDLMALLSMMKSPAAGLQQGYAGGQGGGFRRGGYREALPCHLRADAENRHRPQGEYAGGRRERVYQRDRLRRLPHQKGRPFPGCLQDHRAAGRILRRKGDDP